MANKEAGTLHISGGRGVGGALEPGLPFRSGQLGLMVDDTYVVSAYILVQLGK